MKGKQKSSRKKKKKNVHRPVTETRLKSRKHKEIIPKLHLLNRRKELLKQDTSLTDGQKKGKIEEIDKELQELGGLNAYQQLSKLGESAHGNYSTAKWVVQQMKKHKHTHLQEDSTLRLLDVGALHLNYEDHKSWITTSAIDLNPQNLNIQKANFLTFKCKETSLYDVIVLSLVLNFEGDPTKRGEMLKHAANLCKLSGFVFIMLPLACVSNSRYMTHDLLKDMMVDLGFDLESSHSSEKLSFKMFSKKRAVLGSRQFPKQKLHDGKKMNNFCIVISR